LPRANWEARDKKAAVGGGSLPLDIAAMTVRGKVDPP